ncbi:TDT family transporter [Bifidobacterium imperatoris]|uniref:C4-dicarboxylate transporter/malic acid transport protein n=2 Tax=Bifidobacterium imperatoris TaxID=2020965 RepID=A0A2N5IU13_9BIFI|nr:TDT family transporter [Bifidobacterium imperatoris]PLS25428.1 C4-dicarboxylate transporter/malic acid transport protein [Bifidobacterium imperatoris]
MSAAACGMKIASATPLPQAGVALAAFSYGNLAASLLPEFWWTPIHIVSAILGLMLLIPVLAKHCIAIRSTTVRTCLATDYRNPMIAPLTTTMPMALITLGTYFAHFGSFGLRCAQIIWWCGVLCIASLMVYFAWRFIVREFHLTSVCPAWLVGFVGILVAAVTSGTVGLAWAGHSIFVIGFVIDIIMLVLISSRIAWHGLPAGIRPTMTIYSAPISLLVASYYSTSATHNPIFMLMLLTCSQFLFAFVAVLLPWMLATPPSPAYAAFTFPLVITATALQDALLVFKQAGWHVPLWAHGVQLGETALAGVMIILATVVFVRIGKRAVLS